MPIGLAVVFGVYVAKSDHPFVTKEFLRNGPYMVFLAILFIGFFFEYAITPIYQVIGEGVFHLSLQTVSYCLTAVNVVAMVIGVLSVRARRALAASAPSCSPSWTSSQASCSQRCSCAPASGSSLSSTRSSWRAGRLSTRRSTTAPPRRARRITAAGASESATS